MPSAASGVYASIQVYNSTTRRYFSADRMCVLESDVIASLNTITLSFSGSNYQGSPVNWAASFDMHSQLYFCGGCYDFGWELPFDWRSIPVPVGEVNFRAYHYELERLAEKYKEFIQAQSEVVDALVLDLITIRRLMAPQDEREAQQLQQDKFKQFYIGKDEDIDAAITMQSKILFVLEENLHIIQEWIYQLSLVI